MIEPNVGCGEPATYDFGSEHTAKQYAICEEHAQELMQENPTFIETNTLRKR